MPHGIYKNRLRASKYCVYACHPLDAHEISVKQQHRNSQYKSIEVWVGMHNNLSASHRIASMNR